MKNTILLILFFSNMVFNQAKEDLLKLTAADFDNVKITREINFDGNALWGYIDGGADIYLEYGFDKLLLQEIEWENNKFRVEYYKMKNAAASFGIFSVLRFNCEKYDMLTKFICITPYQVQAAIGRFYISVSNEKGDKGTEKLTTELVSKILSKSKEVEFTLPEYFKDKSLAKHKNEIKYFRGKLGIQNGYSAWIDLFEEFSNYEIFFLPVEKKSGYENISLIKFQEGGDLQKFLSFIRKKKENNIFYKTETISNTEIIFTETNVLKQ